jgi:parvulin-like peptidyl-prolyl isomerase
MKMVTKLLTTLLVFGSIATAQTLVTVNGVAISQKDVDTELMNATQGRFNQVPADKQAEFRKQVLQQLIAKELIFEDAKKTGVLKSKEFKDEFEKIKKRIEKDLAIQVWQKRELDKIKVSDKKLKDYYNKNKDEFIEKESVHARHILVKTEDEAKKIVSELKSLKADALKDRFIALAKEKSTGPSGPNGGDLGYFAQGQMVPEFNDKVFSMKVGTISQPVKTQFGYHVIYLEDKKDKKTRPFAEVKTFIEQRLKMEKFKTIIQAKMKALQEKADIK